MESNIRNCKIIIRSESGGEKSEFVSNGTATLTPNGISFSYLLENDKCSLEISGAKVIQKRAGFQPLEIVFEKGKTTLCTIGSGAFEGSFEIFTHQLNFINGAGGVKLALEYDGITDGERVKLSFTAVYQ